MNIRPDTETTLPVVRLLQRRVAIDVGSGMTKFQIADVALDSESGKNASIQKTLYFKEHAVPFAIVWRESGDFTEYIRNLGLETMRNIREKTSEYEVEQGEIGRIQVSAVGTEVFRRAKSGPEFLKEVENETGIKVKLIPQEKEAVIGYKSGLAVLEQEMKYATGVSEGSQNCCAKLFDLARIVGPDLASKSYDLWTLGLKYYLPNTGIADAATDTLYPLSSISYKYKRMMNSDASTLSDVLSVFDVGGASFQITSSKHWDEPILGTQAFSQTCQMLADIRAPTMDKDSAKPASPTLAEATKNPVSQLEWVELVERAKQCLNSHTNIEADGGCTNWVKGEELVCLSGSNGLGRVSGDCVTAHQLTSSGKSISFQSDSDSPFSPFAFTAEDLRVAIRTQFAEKSEKELTNRFLQFEGAEPACWLIPKACCMLAIMEFLEIKRMHWRPVVGSCPGILVDEELYTV